MQVQIQTNIQENWSN